MGKGEGEGKTCIGEIDSVKGGNRGDYVDHREYGRRNDSRIQRKRRRNGARERSYMIYPQLFEYSIPLKKSNF